MRVFLDTNVLVSAFATRGACRDLFRLVLAEHEFLCGEVVLGELREVLSGRFGLPERIIAGVIKLLRSYPVTPRPSSPPEISVRDPDDLWILASALDSKADVLVTGDKDLLTLPALPTLRITDPRGFWSLVKANPAR